MTFYFSSISPKVDNSVKKMGKLLQEVKGGGQGQAISKSEVAAAADGILGPLMDLLDGKHSILVTTSWGVGVPTSLLGFIHFLRNLHTLRSS